MLFTKKLCQCLLPLLVIPCGATKVYVMLPLDEVTSHHTMKNKTGLGLAMDKLKAADVDGFMLDIWWGLTEPSPKEYSFSTSRQIVDMAKDRDLEVQLVTSFHQCGGNVGDVCHIPIPSWVKGNNLWYKDAFGNEDHEVVSLFADNEVVEGRTILQIYSDWFEALAEEFSDEFGGTVVQIQVGMGPCGELRYPAYQLSHWDFCGIGAFQCYSTDALARLKAAAESAGHPEWASPPSGTGNYKNTPDEAPFFVDGYKSDHGKFFLDWYFESLKTHGAAVLSRAWAVFGGKVGIAGKIAGIHWWYESPSHAAELTAGYYNVNGRNAYSELTEMFGKHNAAVDFTCLEMLDTDHDPKCKCGPEGLVAQVEAASREHGIDFNGENAIARYDQEAYSAIERYRAGMPDFTYLRMSPTLMSDENLPGFTAFVHRMHSKDKVTFNTEFM